jgi:hypothetical protein
MSVPAELARREERLRRIAEARDDRGAGEGAPCGTGSRLGVGAPKGYFSRLFFD